MSEQIRTNQTAQPFVRPGEYGRLGRELRPALQAFIRLLEDTERQRHLPKTQFDTMLTERPRRAS